MAHSYARHEDLRVRDSDSIPKAKSPTVSNMSVCRRSVQGSTGRSSVPSFEKAAVSYSIKKLSITLHHFINI